MADPGTLIPTDATGAHIDTEYFFFPPSSPLPTDVVPSHMASSSAGNKELMDRGEYPSSVAMLPRPMNKELAFASSRKPGLGYAHAISPSWTEGVSSPAVRRKKVKDVSQYMIDAAKENPQLSNKLHDVLLESGVFAPPDLFTEICPERTDVLLSDDNSLTLEKEKKVDHDKHMTNGYSNLDQSFLPPLPHHGFQSRGDGDKHPQQRLNKNVTVHDVSPDSELAPSRCTKNVPVAAAAAANSDPKLQLPVAATTATTATVTKQYEALESAVCLSGSPGANSSPMVSARSSQDDRDNESAGANPEGERISDRSTGMKVQNRMLHLMCSGL